MQTSSPKSCDVNTPPADRLITPVSRTKNKPEPSFLDKAKISAAPEVRLRRAAVLTANSKHFASADEFACQKIMNFKQYKTLVLSGNSTNSILVLGALQRMFEKHALKTVQTYVAVSSGTIISVLLAIGYTPLEILIYICSEQVYKTVPVFNLLNVLVTGKPALDFAPIKTCLEKMICLKLGHVPTLKALYELTKKTIIFSVYNLTDKKREYISVKNHEALLVTDAIHMSCNFPIIFKPFEFNNKLYIDGGLADAFPIDLAIAFHQNPILGIYIKNPIPDYRYQETTANVFHLLKTLFSVYTEESLEDKVLRNSTKCDIMQLCHESNFFNFNSNNQDILHLFDLGYQQAC